MTLSDNNRKFKLDIIGREFESGTSYHDCNWLTVKIEVIDGIYNWIAKDNCLLSYELESLRLWIEKIAFSEGRRIDYSEITFTENELAFRYDRDGNVILPFLTSVKTRN